MNDLINTLVDVGFSKNEANIYLIILENKNLFISDITKNSSLKRSSVINYVNTLVDRGIISKIIVGRRVSYIAENPDNILKDLELKKLKFEKDLPQLQSLLLSSSDKAKVRYFEGIVGIKNIYKEVLGQFKPVLTFISIYDFYNKMGNMEVNKLRNIRVKNGTKINELLEDNEFSRDLLRDNGKSIGSNNKWLPKTFPVNIDLLIWGDNIAMISFQKNMGVIIENKEISNFHRTIHNHFWNL